MAGSSFWPGGAAVNGHFFNRLRRRRPEWCPESPGVGADCSN